MDIEEIKKRKIDLETGVLGLLNQFEKDTQVQVTELRIVDCRNANGELFQVIAKIHLY